MLQAANRVLQYRELLFTLAWKSVVVRYKQAYLGLIWTVAKPLVMMLIFMLMRSFVSIDSGDVPYAVLSYSALVMWTLFQESASDGVGSVVGNAHLIKKIYFPREVFPLTAVLTKLVEFCINFAILLVLMAMFGIRPSAQAVWVPLLVAYAVFIALAIAFVGAAVNVYYRDVAQMLPVVLNLLMYASPVIYPLHLVQQRLLAPGAAGGWGERLYTLYLANPLSGLIDAFQRVMLRDLPPDGATLLPGIVVVAVLLPLSYRAFKRAESHFADVI